jgi:hypothetical protein
LPAVLAFERGRLEIINVNNNNADIMPLIESFLLMMEILLSISQNLLIQYTIYVCGHLKYKMTAKQISNNLVEIYSTKMIYA